MNAESQLFLQAHEAIRVANRILLVGDEKPDGDSLGSASAVLNWLLREGKDVTAYSKESAPLALSYLDQIHRFRNDAAVFDATYDLIITFDTGDTKRAGLLPFLSKIHPDCKILVLDHHVTNTRFGHLNLVFTDACSTAEVVYRLLEANNVLVDDRMATSLLTGILYDTSYFSNSGTTTSAMEIASVLVARGARHTEIIHHLLKNKSVPGLKLWGVALSRLTVHPTWNLAHTYFLHADLKDVPGAEEAIEGMSNFLNAVCSGVDTVLVLRERPDGTVTGSIRSIGRDISQVAKLLGGGGHKKAAGFTVRGRLEIKNGAIRLTEPHLTSPS